MMRLSLALFLLLSAGAVFCQMPTSERSVPFRVRKKFAAKDLRQKPKIKKDLDPALVREVDACLKKLGAASFKTRRQASKRLLEIATIHQNAIVAKKKSAKPSVDQSLADSLVLELVFTKDESNLVELLRKDKKELLNLGSFLQIIKPFPYLWLVIGHAGKYTTHHDPEVAVRARRIIDKCKAFAAENAQDHYFERW